MKQIRNPATMQRTASPRLALEARIVFDAAVAATVTDLMDRSSNHDIYVPPAVSEPAREPIASPVTEAAPEQIKDVMQELRTEVAPGAQRVEIIFVDAAVEDIQSYLVGKNAELVVLDAGRDGVEQIAQALAGRTDIAAIHIVSHGEAGELRLGTGTLSTRNISGSYADELATIKGALSEEADILVYGCNAGAGEAGQAFVSALAGATGADVNASVDDTGATALGGNWVLESKSGRIETLSISASDWNGLLNVAANNGSGALLGVTGRDIYSIDITTGKATLVTTVPATVGGITISATVNSLAVDQGNGLIYYCDSNAVSANVALFAYDYRTVGISDAARHIVIDTDLTNNGVGLSIAVGGRGVGSGAATFANGTLYLGVERSEERRVGKECVP